MVAVLVGCASSGTNFDSRKVTDIHKGETTEPQLVAMFGKPNMRGVNSETGTTLTWIYVEARAKGETFIPLAGAFVGGVKSKTKSLIISLNQEGTVDHYNYSGGGFDSGNGMQSDPEDSKPPGKARSPKDQ